MLSWVEYGLFIVLLRATRLEIIHLNLLYLFATVVHDLSHGDGRRIADLETRARMRCEGLTMRLCGAAWSALSQNMTEYWTYPVACCILRFDLCEGGGND